MAASSSSGIVDPTKTAKYPLILSDALIGKTTTEIFTGVRYNHRPAAVSSESSPLGARLKPSVSAGNPSGGYDLSFLDPSTKRAEYTYAGARTTDDGQYVLYFDPARRVFVLDRVDSVFHMNLTRTPDTPDPDALSQQFEQLGTSTRPRPPPAEENDDGEEDAPAEADDDETVMIMMMEEAAAAAAAAATTTKAEKPKETTKRSAAASAAAPATIKRATTSSAKKTKGSARRDAAAPKSAPSSRKPQASRPTKKAATVGLALPDATSEHPSPALPSRPARPEPTLPTVAPAAAAKKRQLRSRESDDSDNSDNELILEFPGSSEGGRFGQHEAAPPPARVQIRRFSDFMREKTTADDADPEDEFDEERDLNSFRLPSPARNSGGSGGGGSGYYASQLDQDSPMHMDHHGDNGEDTHDGEDAEEAGAAGADQAAGEADLEDDLEAQLEAELAGEESEVSEED